VIIPAVEIIPLYAGNENSTASTESVKIVCINLLSSNRQIESVEQFIDEQNTDILVLQEFTPFWQSMITKKLAGFPYQKLIPREDNFGIAVFSKIKVKSFEEKQFGKSGVPSVQADLELDKSGITFIATHPLPPVGKSYSDMRNEHLSNLANDISKMENDVVLVGDLNTSSFSVHFKDLIRTSGLRDSRRGFGILPTWPSWFFPLQTTLDHCLVSDGIVVKSRLTGNDIGSDHLPIIVELDVR
jgi:endonuclease/exonuclease/phosphatase (EEP) superfamily protein YafD